MFSPKKGPKKDRGLSVFLDRSSGGPVLAKMGRSGRSLRTGPRTDPSLVCGKLGHYFEFLQHHTVPMLVHFSGCLRIKKAFYYQQHLLASFVLHVLHTLWKALSSALCLIFMILVSLENVKKYSHVVA